MNYGILKHFNPVIFYDQDPDAGGGSNGGGKTVTMTQEQMDVLFSERAKRGEEAALGKILQKTGFSSIDELSAAVMEYRKIKDAGDPEKAKLMTDLDAETKKREKAEADLQAFRSETTERLMKAEVKAKAKEKGFRPEAVDDVWLIVDRAKITVDDAGEFQGVDEAIDDVAKSKPFWLSSTQDKPRGTPKDGKKAPPTGEDDASPKPTIRL